MGYILTTIAFLSLLTLTGVGLHISVSLAGKMLLAFPVIYITSEYTLALSQRAGLAPWTAFALALLAALITGFGLALLERRLPKDSFAVIGLAASFAFVALAKSWQSLTNGVLGIAGIERPAGLESLEAMALFCLVLAILVLSFEWVLLKSPLSRRWRALKEAPHLLDGMGVSSKQVSFATLLLASLIIGLTTPYAWLYQYLDPSTGGIAALLRGLSIAILATQAKVSRVILASLFVTMLPELLRFLDLPSSVMGPLRSILYSVVLIILLFALQKRTFNTNRQI